MNRLALSKISFLFITWPLTQVLAQLFNTSIIFPFPTLDGPIKETWKVWVKNVKSNPSVEQAPFVSLYQSML